MKKLSIGLIVLPILLLTGCIGVGPWGGVSISDPLGIESSMRSASHSREDRRQDTIFTKAMAQAVDGDPFAQVFVAEYIEYYRDGKFVGLDASEEHREHPKRYIDQRIAWLKKAQEKSFPLAYCAMSELYWNEGDARENYYYTEQERIALLEKAIELNAAESGMAPVILANFYSFFGSGDIDTSARILYDSVIKGNQAALSRLLYTHQFFNYSAAKSGQVAQVWDCTLHPQTGACQVHAKLPQSLPPDLRAKFIVMQEYSISPLRRTSSCVSQFDVPDEYKGFRNY